MFYTVVTVDSGEIDRINNIFRVLLVEIFAVELAES